MEQTPAAALDAPPIVDPSRVQALSGVRDTITAQTEGRDYSPALGPSPDQLDGANGLTNWDRKTVQVRADMDEAFRVGTAIHELAHCLFHEPVTLEARPQCGRHPSRGALEVESESVAFAVADAHHLPADDYSFPYLAAWAGPDGIDVVRAATQRVAAIARQIIGNSTAEHTTGGRVPGVEQVLAARPDRARLQRRYALQPPPVVARSIEASG